MSIELHCGTGRADITPAPNMPGGIWKTQKHIRAAGIHRPLYVTALALAEGDETLLLLSFDLCFLTAPQVATITRALVDGINLPAERFWLFVTHTHAPPLTQEAYSGEGEAEVRAYVATLPKHAVAAARQALADLAPARLAAGQGQCDIGVNRNLIVEGRTIVAPNPAGHSDPTVGVLRVDRLDGTPLICLASYGCHPHVLGPDNQLISPDYPGVMRDLVEEATGARCLFLQGAGGNVCTRETFSGDIEVAERLGRILACEVIGRFLRIETDQPHFELDHVVESAAPLGFMRRVPAPSRPARFSVIAELVRLPVKPELAQRQQRLTDELEDLSVRLAVLEEEGDAAGLNTARIAKMRVATQLDQVRRAVADGFVDIMLRGFRAGDIGFIAAEAEVFSELGAAVRRASPFDQTVFAAYLGKSGEYLAPASYYTDRPGYEIEYSPFSSQAGEMFVDQAAGLLKRLRAS